MFVYYFFFSRFFYACENPIRWVEEWSISLVLFLFLEFRTNFFELNQFNSSVLWWFVRLQFYFIVSFLCSFIKTGNLLLVITILFSTYFLIISLISEFYWIKWQEVIIYLKQINEKNKYLFLNEKKKKSKPKNSCWFKCVWLCLCVSAQIILNFYNAFNCISPKKNPRSLSAIWIIRVECMWCFSLLVIVAHLKAHQHRMEQRC